MNSCRVCENIPIVLCGRLMSRTGRSKPNRSPFTGRRINSTMKFLPRAITILRNLSFTLQGRWLGNWIDYFCPSHLVLTTNYHYICLFLSVSLVLTVIRTFTLLKLLLLSLRKLPSTWLCSSSECCLLFFCPLYYNHFMFIQSFNLSPQFEVLQELIHLLFTQAWSWACCSGCTTSSRWRWWSDRVERIMSLCLEQELCLAF